MSACSVEGEWTELCTELKIEPAIANKWWKLLKDKYSEDHRHYHTLEHLSFMLERLPGSPVNKPLVVKLAIFFHDIVYDPHASDNERKSAELFTEFSRQAGVEGVVGTSEVVDMIILTETHTTPEHSDTTRFGTSDEHVMLDLDMSILGEPWHVYEKYAGKIRHEYIHIPKEDYCRRRAEVLKKFLMTKRIYSTKRFSALEDTARTNIEREIDLLTAGHIPGF